MIRMENTTETIEKKLGAACFKCTDNIGRFVRRFEFQKNVNMVLFSSDLLDGNANRSKEFDNNGKNILKSFTRKYSVSKLSNEYNVEIDGKDTMCVTSKIKIPVHHWSFLDNLHRNARIVVRRMLKDRTKTSTKYYKEVPSVIAKSLSAKYQRNKKCKSVKNLVMPISGDKGRAIKWEKGGIRVPSIFKKEIIPFHPTKTVLGVRAIELFKKRSVWYVSIVYETPVIKQATFKNVMGVDRNVRGNVATCALSNGKVRKFGPDMWSVKNDHRNRIKKLQSKNKMTLCKKLSGTQRNKQRDVNHKVSKSIVDLASETSSAIVLENLSGIRKGKAKRFVNKTQWAEQQLDVFIRYKAALSGVPVFYVSPYNTSKACSKCGAINSPNGKDFKCKICDYGDDRDANAAFNIRNRFLKSNVMPRACDVRHIGEPLTNPCFVNEKLISYAK